MKIAVIVAMRDELPIDKIKDLIISQKEILGFEFIQIKNNKHDVIITYSKIGKANAAACTALTINEYKPDLIINIGCAGCVDRDINIFDTIVVEKYFYTDVDATKFGYKMGQVPQEKEYYSFNAELNKEVKNIIGNCYIKNIGTSDSFITNENYKDYANLDLVSCVDMEAASIAQIVSKTNIKLISIKIVVDSIYRKIESREKWNNELKKIQQNLIDTILKIINEIKWK